MGLVPCSSTAIASSQCIHPSLRLVTRRRRFLKREILGVLAKRVSSRVIWDSVVCNRKASQTVPSMDFLCSTASCTCASRHTSHTNGEYWQPLVTSCGRAYCETNHESMEEQVVNVAPSTSMLKAADCVDVVSSTLFFGASAGSRCSRHYFTTVFFSSK